MLRFLPLLFLAACAPQDISCSSPRVIDGDTMVCADHRIRLWGIDAPESRTPEGPPATQQLIWLTSGMRVHCKPVDTDRYGRTVAMCWVNGTDIAEQMVAMGQARDWPRFSHGYYAHAKGP